MAGQDFVVIARFDDAAEEKFIALRRCLRKRGLVRALSEWPPHITIAAYETVELDALLQWTEEFCRGHRAFGVRFPSLGLFPPGGCEAP